MRKVRRSHTKSRKGCLQCKNGHVKCDETMPTCGLCQKRKQECTWPSGSTNDAHSQDSSTPRDGSDMLVGTSESPASFASDHSRLLEMRLFHHYMVDTYLTMPEGRLTYYHFQNVIPRVAASHAFLLDGILALSAMHMAFQEPEEVRYWLDIGLKYQTNACSSLSRLLVMEVSGEMFGPAFLCSVFIMLTATAYPSVSPNKNPFNPISQVLEVRRLLAGCSLMMAKLRHSVTPEMLPWFNVQGSIPKDDSAREGIQDQNLLLLHSALLASLYNIYPFVESSSEPQKTACQSTWELLRDSVQSWPLAGARGGFIAFPINISEAYLTLLQEDDWLCRILFLHYGVGLHLHSDRWYVGDWGRRLVGAVLESAEDEVPLEWVDVVLWTRQAVGLDAVS